MSKVVYESMKTSKLLDLLTGAVDDELNNILSEIETRTPFRFYDVIIKELEDKIETLESEFKRHIHSGNKVYIESK